MWRMQYNHVDLLSVFLGRRQRFFLWRNKKEEINWDVAWPIPLRNCSDRASVSFSGDVVIPFKVSARVNSTGFQFERAHISFWRQKYKLNYFFKSCLIEGYISAEKHLYQAPQDIFCSNHLWSRSIKINVYCRTPRPLLPLLSVNNSFLKKIRLKSVPSYRLL